MKPRTFFMAVTGPFVLWVALSALLSGWVQMLPEDRALGPMARMLLAGQLAGVRAMPYAVLAGAIAPPVLTLLAAVVVKPSVRGRAGMSAALPWVAGLIGAVIALVAVLVTERAARLALPVVWCFATTQAILVGIAFRAQSALRAHGVTRVPGWAVLGPAVLLQLAFLWPAAVLVMLVPLLSGWRELEAA